MSDTLTVMGEPAGEVTGFVRTTAAEWLAVSSAVALAIAGYGFYTALPMLLGAIAQTGHFSDQEIGWLGSAELFGMLGGSLLAPLVVAGHRFRLWSLCSLGIFSLGLAGAWLGGGLPASAVSRLCGGIGGGLAYSIAVSWVAITRHPTRYFGVMNAGGIFAAAFQDYFTPGLILRHGIVGGLMPPVLMVSVALVLLPTMRHHDRAVAEQNGTSLRATLDKTSWLFLVGVAICHIAPGAFWTYVERLAEVGRIGPSIVAATLTAGLVASGVVCLGSERVAARHGARKAMLAAVALLVLIMASNILGGAPMFVTRYLAFACCWNLLIVFQLSAATDIDPSGRVAALVPAAQNVGILIGPTAGASILMWGGSIPVMLALMSLTLAAGLIFSAGAYRRASHDRGSAG